MTKRIKKACVYLVAITWAVILICPFLWALRISLIPTYTTFVSFFPKSISELSLINYKYLLFRTNFLKWLVNSLIVSTSATLLNIITSFLLGYVLARKKLPGSSVIFMVVLGLMMIPYHVTAVPLYLGLSKIRLTNTLLGVILPLSANAFGVFLMRQYILMIPSEYEEAALVDGCSQMGAIFRIVLPQALPAIGILAVTMFFETWNNFIIPLIMVTRDSMKTVSVGVADLAFQVLNVNWGVLMAGSLLGALPTVLLYVAFNRYFLRGLTLHGGLK